MKANRLLLFLFLFSCTCGFAQNRTIHLASGPVTTSNNINAAVVDSFNNNTTRFQNKAFALLQFATIPNAAARKILDASGISLLEYIPENAYTVTVFGNLQLEALQQAGVVALLQLSAPQKMERRLQTGIPAWASKIPGTVDVWISFPSSFRTADVLTGIRNLNMDVVASNMMAYRILAVRVATNRVQELASQPFVEYLQLAPRGDQPLNFNSRAASRANVLNAGIGEGGKGLKGEGVVIGVGDNADVQSHIDFAGRLINRNYMPASGHGHHVTGTVGGAGNGNDFFRGYAPKSTIISHAYSGVLLNATAYVADYGMVLTNNSYGDNVECSYYGVYDLYSRWMDQQAFELPYLQHIFASGNSGSSTCTPFLPSFHTVLGGYQSAKNVLTVGATTDSGAIAAFSSKGPVRDGRTKPEITAMGQQVASAWPVNFYSYNNGTSMASPAVAGGAALLYQRYRQLHAGANPKNALIKAVLCNGAADKGTTGPDFQYGYGWMNLLRSVEMLENNWYLSGSSGNGTTNTHTISIPANTSKVKVMLYWNDPAASPLAAKTLVNDLDLELVNGAATILPAILDTLNSNLANGSFEGADHTNNMEQVVINNPAAGNLTIRVKGTAVTQQAPQEYFLVYDLLPSNQIRLTSPAGGETWIPSASALGRMKISWDAYGYTTGTVAIDFSADNGNTWTNLATNVDINRVIYSWHVPNVSAAEARIRITHEGNGQAVTSQPFAIMPLPVVTEAAVQCEGYFNINWTAVAGATDYEVMMLIGDEMQTVATTTGNNYVFSGLSRDSTYWVTVRPRINGKAGRRAVAISRKPVGGSCAGTISDNDLSIDAVIAPVSGRRFTATQPLPNAQVTIRIRNHDDAPQSNFDLKYAVNGGAFITETITAPLAPGATLTHTFATTVDLSAVDNYYFTFIVKNNLPDPVSNNDTLERLVRHLDNQPLNLAAYFIDNMETAHDVVYETDTIGLFGLGRYDFTHSTIAGRLRTFINTGTAYSGNKALTLDVNSYLPSGNTNYLYGTYNLVNYNVHTNDLRLDFHYNNHGQQPHPNNTVWIRGSDADPWIDVFDLAAEQLDPGVYKKTGSIEIADILAANGQQFTPSFGIRWGQWGQLSAVDRFFAGGYSFDDVRIYQVFNDLQMESLDEPVANSCALGAATVVRVTVKNSANHTITNIPVKYRVNSGGWITEQIAAIPGNGFVQYSFNATADLSALGSYTIETVVDYGADSFHENDTLRSVVVNSPVIASFPHLESFEISNGYWYSGGKNSSWEYGTPASNKVKGAASGAKAWKTRLVGHYNDNEYSYLYSPCYDISAMTHPRLSFSMAVDVEDCGSTVCDAGWMEYSTDGESWNKLGSYAAGTNWYNHQGDDVWSVQNFTNWHVATTALPPGESRLRLRFVMHSDGAVNREGLAIDDIHIYDSVHGIYDGPTMAAPVSQSVSGNGWMHFTTGSKLVASIHPNNQNLGATDAQAFIYAGPVRHTPVQYYLDRNITIKPTNPVSDSITIRFYYLDSESDSLLKATNCAGCSKPPHAYGFGVSAYTDTDPNFENGTIADNNQGIWNYIPTQDVVKIPFDKGYYAEFRVAHLSEFWLNTAPMNGSVPLPVKLMEFEAKKSGNDVSVTWKIGSETSVARYEIELARGADALQAGIWAKIGEVASLGNTTSIRNYSFLDTETGKMGARYYRLKTVNLDGSFVYSPVRSVIFSDGVLMQVYPNPSPGHFQILYQLGSNEPMTARVLDAKGRTVRQYATVGNGQVQQLQIDLTLQATGVYLLELRRGSEKQVYKLYKQ